MPLGSLSKRFVYHAPLSARSDPPPLLFLLVSTLRPLWHWLLIRLAAGNTHWDWELPRPLGVSAWGTRGRITRRGRYGWGIPPCTSLPHGRGGGGGLESLHELTLQRIGSGLRELTRNLPFWTGASMKYEPMLWWCSVGALSIGRSCTGVCLISRVVEAFSVGYS